MKYNIKETSKRVVDSYNKVGEYKLVDNAAHKNFIYHINNVAHERLDYKISDKGSVVAHKGSTSSEDAKENIKRIANNLKKFGDNFNNICENNDLAWALILRSRDLYKHDGEVLTDFFTLLPHVENILINSLKLKVNRGTNTHPEWLHEVAELSRKFWLDTTGKKATIKFEDASNPENDFCKWFCELMKITFNVPNNTCEIILKKRTKKFNSLSPIDPKYL